MGFLLLPRRDAGAQGEGEEGEARAYAEAGGPQLLPEGSARRAAAWRVELPQCVCVFS